MRKKSQTKTSGKKSLQKVSGKKSSLKKSLIPRTKKDMLEILKTKGKSQKDFKIGSVVVANNKMDKNYSYRLDAKVGDIEFDAQLSPKEMLEHGVFEGKYLNDCILEFPKEWFMTALKKGKLSPEKPDISCNYFKIKSRQSLQTWRNNGWIPITEGDPDNRGWFQWYCRYYLGRRIPHVDDVQIGRWNKFKRHLGQVKKNCSSISCRPKQRQALLQWAYDPFV